MSNEVLQEALELLAVATFITPKLQAKRTDVINAGLQALAEQPAQQEPWGACVYGRVFVGRLPEHARKFSEDEGVSIQWLYTSPPAQRKPLTPEWIWTWLMDWCKRNGSSPANYNSLFKMVADARAIEAAHGIKENT